MRDVDCVSLHKTVSRWDADAEPHGWAKFNQHGACLSKVLPIHVSHLYGTAVFSITLFLNEMTLAVLIVGRLILTMSKLDLIV